jgi:hypothetical protein
MRSKRAVGSAYRRYDWPDTAGAFPQRASQARPRSSAVSPPMMEPIRRRKFSGSGMSQPPGRARLVTKPLPTGSETWVNTTGIVLVSLCSSANPVQPATTSCPSSNGPILLQRLFHGRHRRRSSDTRPARCGPRSSPAFAGCRGTPRCELDLRDRSENRRSACRSVELGPPAARAPRAAMMRPLIQQFR